MNTRMTEANDPFCLGPGEAETLLAGAPWRRLLVMGDSIAAGNGDPIEGYLDRSWADRLAAALSRAARLDAYLNLGHVGARAGEVREGQLDRALAFRPDLAMVAAGANDTFRRSFTAAAVEAELAQILGALDDGGALVVTFGCFDLGRTSFAPAERRPVLSERLHALGRLTESVTRRHRGVHVDFLRHPALDDGLISADRIHINRRGHAIVAAEVIRSLVHRLAGQATGAPLAS
jgi:lysophospholipase L1-like esterase